MKTNPIIILLLCFFLIGGFTEVVAKEEKKEKKPVPEFPFKRFYAEVSLGYGFVFSSVHLEGASSRGLFPSGIDLKNHRQSFGNGLHAGVDLGYRFNRYLAIDLGGKYMVYSTMEDWAAVLENPDINGIPLAVNEKDLSSESGHISLQLVASPDFKRVDPYVKAGLVFSIARIHADQYYGVYDQGVWQYGSNIVFNQQFTGTQWAFRAGFAGAVGMNIHLSKLISLSVEWQFSVSGLVDFDWGDLKLKSEQGDRNAAAGLLNKEPERYTGTDHLSFNSHGLRIGVKFKF